MGPATAQRLEMVGWLQELWPHPPQRHTSHRLVSTNGKSLLEFYFEYICIYFVFPLQVSTAGTPLLGNPSALPLGFGMLGGLVPVSLPFQFPSLLNFSPPGASGAAGMGTAPSSNSGYPLAQSDLMGEWALN